MDAVQRVSLYGLLAFAFATTNCPTLSVLAMGATLAEMLRWFQRDKKTQGKVTE